MTLSNGKTLRQAREWASTQTRRLAEELASRSTRASSLLLDAKLRSASSGFESRLHRSLGPGLVAVDVGAHIGMISALYADNFESVWAIEPNPELAKRLRATFAHRGTTNVNICQLALSDEPGTATLSVPKFHGRSVGSLGSLMDPDSSGSSDVFEVEVTTLDSLVDGPIDVLKVDAEGFEVEVLKGASRLLAGQPIVVVESEERHRPGAPAAVREILESHGLTGLILLRGQVVGADRFDPVAHKDMKPSLLGEVPEGYVENYIFVPANDRARWVKLLQGLVDE